MSNRRAFLKFLAGSPLLAGASSIVESLAQQAPPSVIDKAADALDVFEFEAAARKVLPPAHWGYMATGVDGEDTLRANREGFNRYQLRTRRFVDVSRLDMSTDLFGMKVNSPIILCPVGSQKAFHPEGEVAVARAAKAKGHLQILSTQTSSSVEDVIKARGGPIWYQLYTTDSFDVTTKLVKRAEAAGCPVVAITVDLPNGRNTETATRFQRQDARVCANCHETAEGDLASPLVGGGTVGKPMFTGIDMRGRAITSPSLTWEFIKRVKDITKMKVLIKGLETREDAALAVQHGADALSFRITADERLKRDALPSSVWPKLFKVRAGGFLSSWTAVSVAARMSSKLWPWVPMPSGSAAPTFGACPHSASKASNAFWIFSITNSSSQWSVAVRDR